MEESSKPKFVSKKLMKEEIDKEKLKNLKK